MPPLIYVLILNAFFCLSGCGESQPSKNPVSSNAPGISAPENANALFPDDSAEFIRRQNAVAAGTGDSSVDSGRIARLDKADIKAAPGVMLRHSMAITSWSEADAQIASCGPRDPVIRENLVAILSVQVGPDGKNQNVMSSELLRYDQRYEMILGTKLETPDDIACEPWMLDLVYTQFYDPHEQQWLQQIERRYQQQSQPTAAK